MKTLDDFLATIPCHLRDQAAVTDCVEAGVGGADQGWGFGRGRWTCAPALSCAR